MQLNTIVRTLKSYNILTALTMIFLNIIESISNTAIYHNVFNSPHLCKRMQYETDKTTFSYDTRIMQANYKRLSPTDGSKLKYRYRIDRKSNPMDMTHRSPIQHLIAF